MNDNCLEKICGVAAAAGIIGVGTALAAPVAVGVVEAVISGAGLIVAIRSQHRADFRRALDAIKREVESEYRDWIKQRHGDESWYVVLNVENALAELDGVIDKCVPTPEEVARAGVNGTQLAALLLEKAAAANPVVYAPDADNPAAREILSTIVARTFELIRGHAEYAGRLRSYIDEEALRRLADIKRDTEDIKATLALIAAQVSADKSVPLLMLQEILRRLGEAETPLDAVQIEQRLRAKADEYQELRDRLGRLTNDDPRVQALRREAAGLIGQARFDEADTSLSRAESIDLAAVEELEAIALRRRASAAASRAERATAARLRLDYRTAAAHFAEAATIVANDAAAEWSYRLSQARGLYDQGSEFGDNQALAEAIVVYRDALPLVPRERVPLDWAMTQNNLGNALEELGERESGTERLEEALAAYGAALQEYTRERVPLDWAGTQNNLGTALAALGGRESGTERLKEAAAAYRAALEERTRERVPLDWAKTKHNLANTLKVLGERESGTARLEEAVAAYREALMEWTREQVPLDWAAAQTALADALAKLGQRESGKVRLEEAVQCYRMAMQVWTRERVPLDWALAQGGLGNALSILGERGSGTGRLEEAVSAYRAALQECARKRVPLQWAMTQNNLGNALRTLGEREGGTARLEEAVSAYRAALQEWTRERVPLQWAATQNNLGNALRTLGEREGGTARLEEAVAAYRVALEERTRERAPLDWAMTQNNLGAALRALGKRESGTARLEEAVAAFDASLTVLETVWPAEWVEEVCSRRDATQAEIARRRGAQ